MRIAGFGVEKLEGSRKESVSQSQGRSRSTSDVHASGDRVRRKSGDDRKDSRNLDLRKEHDEMRSRNQVCRCPVLDSWRNIRKTHYWNLLTLSLSESGYSLR